MFLKSFQRSRQLSVLHFVKCVHSSSSIAPLSSSIHQHNVNECHRKPNVGALKGRFLHTDNGPWMCDKKAEKSRIEKERIAKISAEMNMRLVNENSFLSWCRNAYLSTVVGIAMMEQATSTLAQTAGMGAFMIGGMNALWGTGCHVLNLIRLRRAAGMSTFTLSLNVIGSLLHCFFYFFILVCYIGFLDDPNYIRIKNKVHKPKPVDEIGSEV